MKLVNKDIIEITEGLGALIQDTAPLPALVSFAVVRNFKLLHPIAEDLLKEKLKILERYSDNFVVRDDNIAYYNIPEGKKSAANKELEDLLAATTSVPLVTFSLDKVTGHNIPIKTMNILYFMVEEGEGE